MNETSFAHILFATYVLGKPRRACPVLTGWAGSFNLGEEKIDIQMGLWYSSFHQSSCEGLEWIKRQGNIWKECYWA
jgi:hypothetical protein